MYYIQSKWKAINKKEMKADTLCLQIREIKQDIDRIKANEFLNKIKNCLLKPSI